MRHVLLHFHIFKNAGSTIDWSLRRTFDNRFVDHRDDRAMVLGGMDYVRNILAREINVEAMSSHYMAFDPQYALQGIQHWYICLLRKPLLRALSVYEFEKIQSADTPGAVIAKQLDMRGYFEWSMGSDVSPVIRNFQTRYLCGVRGKGAYNLSETEFNKALDQCRQHNVIVGFVERYDESMALFEHVLCQHFKSLDLAYVIQNQSFYNNLEPVAYLKKNLGDILFSDLLGRNSMDVRLYESLERDFEARIAKIPNFESKVQNLKTRSAALHD